MKQLKLLELTFGKPFKAKKLAAEGYARTSSELGNIRYGNVRGEFMAEHARQAHQFPAALAAVTAQGTSLRSMKTKYELAPLVSVAQRW